MLGKLAKYRKIGSKSAKLALNGCNYEKLHKKKEKFKKFSETRIKEAKLGMKLLIKQKLQTY